LLALLAAASPAFAQAIPRPKPPSVNVTFFAGLAATSGLHVAGGGAVGFRVRDSPISLELEYSQSSRESDPGVATISFNFQFQKPLPRSRVQVYGTAGFGAYLLLDAGEPNNAHNAGGGVKAPLAGPLKLRVDYRYFWLSPQDRVPHHNEHRITIGVVAGF
jgi:hypothetical protein